MRQSMESSKLSPFLTPTAVEAWDAWFRWRENGELRDYTVEATWQRVATALAGIEHGVKGAGFERRLLDAFADWQLLPDEHLLASAGTEAISWPDDGLVAVLNLARFVRTRSTPAAVDFGAVQDCARLAVRALDNALVLQGGLQQPKKTLRIGVIGFADALASLAFDYGSTQARGFAQSIAYVLAQGCLHESVALAVERGGVVPCDAVHIEKFRMRGMPEDLIDLARRHGLRYDGLTSISSQPHLAKFANDASDAIAPLHNGRFKLSPAVAAAAQAELRGTMQPWIDEPIARPFQTKVQPMPQQI